MKRFLTFALALATALATSSVAKADSFDFTLSGTGITGSGSLSGSSIGGGEFNITGGSISISGSSTVAGSGGVIVNPYSPAPAYYDATTSTVSATVPPVNDVAFEFDNILTPGSVPQMDSNGFGFLLSGGDIFDLWNFDGTYYWNEYTGQVANSGWLIPLSGNGGDPVEFDASPTPEPSSLLLLGTGLLFMAGLLFWKSKPKMIQVF